MPKTLNLISWNVHFPTFAKDNSYVIDTLESLGKFDVICLQEYAEGGDGRLLEWLKDHQYDVSYLPFASIESYSQGVLIATLKKLDATVKPVILRKDEPIPKRPFVNIRGFLTATISLGSVELSIHNIHLTYPRLHTREMRKREFAELQKYLSQSSNTQGWVMCGDFNFFGKDSRRKYLKDNYQSFTGSLLNKTWRHNKKYTPIRSNLDYFFWRGTNLNVYAKLAPFDSSDHRPLLAEVSL